MDATFARKDEIWIVTSPFKHERFIKDLQKTKPGVSSKFLTLEIPYIKEKIGKSVYTKFGGIKATWD